jgi:ribonuclease J
LQRLLKRELKSRPLVVFMMQIPEKQPAKTTTARRRKRSSSISTTSTASSTPAPVISSRK